MTLVSILENTAKKYPNHTAIKVKKEEITYGDLYQKSINLAQSLILLGVNKGDRIGFLFNKSIESVVSIYGIMMAGGCYVPLDIKSPVDRLQSILNDCGITILISSKTNNELTFLSQTKVKTLISTKINDADTVIETVSWAISVDKKNEQVKLPVVQKEDVSYILYTSGSTGVPKGIVHTHKSATSFAAWGASEFDLTPDDVISNHAPYHFDLSTFDLFASCLVGAKVIIIPEVLTKFPASIVKLIVSEKISVWYSVPSALVHVLQRGALDTQKAMSLRVVLFAGEEFPIKFLQSLKEKLSKEVVLANLYGPTETNVCTFYKLDKDTLYNELPIGKLCAGFDCKIVNDDFEEVPLGQQGELLVKGPHVMQGYWGREDLNKKSFINIDSKIYYRTGDFVKMKTDECFYFLGRKDRQIKLRGFRVELDEVEHILQHVQGVNEGVVYAVNEGDEMQIIGSLTIDASVLEQLSEGVIKKELMRLLPPYALPSQIEILTELPRTSSGKVDRQELITKMTKANI